MSSSEFPGKSVNVGSIGGIEELEWDPCGDASCNYSPEALLDSCLIQDELASGSNPLQKHDASLWVFCSDDSLLSL